MSEDGENEVGEVIRAIARYLEEHPNAADTLEGIRKWWLTGRSSADRLETVEKALECLIASGVIIKRTAFGGQAIYTSVRRNGRRDH